MLYAVAAQAAQHGKAVAWWEAAYASPNGVGFAWLALLAFIRYHAPGKAFGPSSAQRSRNWPHRIVAASPPPIAAKPSIGAKTVGMLYTSCCEREGQAIHVSVLEQLCFVGAVFSGGVGCMEVITGNDKGLRMHNGWEVMAKRWATAVLVAGLGLAGSASATLISRGADLVYDDVLDITWTRNANLPGSSGLTWAQANAWAAGLSYGGFDDWRLPTINLTSPTNNATNCGAVTAAACAASGNELGYMFYQNLAGVTSANMTGTQTAIGGEGLQEIEWVQ